MNDKIDKTRQLLRENELDAVLITGSANRRYLSGFSGSSGALLIGREQAYIITDFRYIEQAKEQAGGFAVKRWKDDFNQSLAMVVKDAGWLKLGFESKHVAYSAFREMKEKLSAELVPLETTAEKQRAIKNETELSILRKGAKVLDRSFEYICAIARPGMTEKELSLDLEMFLRKEGAEEKAFSFIVASGLRGAMPHGIASDKKMDRGEMVTIDFGGIFDGYATDMTRTVALGKPDQRSVDIYNIVCEAQNKAASSVKPGLKGSELDAVARDIIGRAGYKEYFGHGLGHGVGLETHEQPVLNPRSETVLEPGMIVTIEPGIYIPGWGGVRIEDMVLVTEKGCEPFFSSSRDLIII